ncbi:hypothetical protein ACFO5O_12885 [Geojedonia litorea]|uniref:Uncharacterized protein n=1 Tax=Geojedonia litorea TaxID=1268269 RepID=A0ABV9N6U5_9FLAO
MNKENLHTHTLEKLFGSIKLNILKQNETIRIVQLEDETSQVRTLAIVRFFNVKGQNLKEAYEKILNGSLLGKTLCEFNIDFNKEPIGSIQVKIPIWLQKGFKSTKDSSLGFVSQIWVNDSAVSNSFLFSEIIEIIPAELKNNYKHKVKPIPKVEDSIMSLLNEAKIELIKPDHEL